MHIKNAEFSMINVQLAEQNKNNLKNYICMYILKVTVVGTI